MIISLLATVKSGDQDLTNIEILDYSQLPKGDIVKDQSRLWSPHFLHSRKKNQTEKTLIHTVVLDYDHVTEMPIISRYKVYVHQTHSKKWRIIVPLLIPTEVYPDDYINIHSCIENIFKLPNSVDRIARNITTFYYLPPPDVDIILQNANELPIDISELTSSRTVQPSRIYIPKKYPKIDEDILGAFRALHDRFKHNVNIKNLIFSHNKHRIDCPFHQGYPDSICFNTDSFNVHSFHSTCEIKLRDEIRRVTDLSNVQVDKLTYTELFVLYGIHQGLWDWTSVERSYMSMYAHEQYGLLLRLNGDLAHDMPTLMRLLSGDQIAYDGTSDEFLQFDPHEKYYKPTLKDNLTLKLTTEIQPWLAYRYPKEYAKVKGASMSTHATHFINKVKERGIEHLRKLDGLNLRNGCIYFDDLLFAKKIVVNFEPLSPTIYVRNKLNYDYEPHAKCDLWRDTLETYFKNKIAPVMMLQEFFGYCLTDIRRFDKFLLLYGETRSGKSTIALVLKYLVGGATAPLKKLQREDTQHSIRLNKMVFCDEQFKEITPELGETLKLLVSRQPIATRALHKAQVESETFPKIVAAFNIPPDSFQLDNALAARMLVIHFTHTFLGKEDTTLYDRLILEAPGILNWAIEGLQRLIANGKFTTNDIDKGGLVEAMRTIEDSELERFVKLLPFGWYNPQDLVTKFNIECNIMPPMTLHKFTNKLKHHEHFIALRYDEEHRRMFYRKEVDADFL